MVVTRPNIIGRESEIEALETTLVSAKSGNGRTVGLFGEPGIGKTILVAAATESAEMQGFKVIRGYCREHGGAPAYWPWIELIRGLLNGLSDENARQLLGENVSWLAQISPDAARFFSSPETDTASSPSTPEQFRFQLFDALSRTLRTVAENEPLLLIVEDIHWADESSLYLLELLVGSMGDSAVSIIFTSRDAEMADNPKALTKTIGELMRWDVFSRLDLARLTREATADQVTALGGDGNNASLRDAIFASSEGNPFFTAEVVRLLAQEGRLDSSATGDIDVGIPGAVSEVISRRLSGLDENELDLLESCSVIGQEIEIDLLASVSGLSPRELLNNLERPIANQILQLDGSNLRFTHALIGDAVSNGLSVPDRVNRNAQVAESLLEFAGKNLRAYVGRLATHYIAAQAITGTDRAVEFSLLAGEEALRISDFGSGRRHFNLVLEMTENQEIDAVRAQAMAGMWKIVSRTVHESEIAALVPLLTDSFNYFVANGDTRRSIDLAAWPSTSYSSPRGIDDVIARALELVDPNSLEAGQLHARKSITAYMERMALSEARQNFDQAVRIARKFNDKDLELAALAAMLSSYGHSDTGIMDDELIARGVELANDTSDLFLESVVLFRMVLWYETNDDPQSARRCMNRAREIDDIIKSPNRKTSNLAIESSLYMDHGEWDKSRHLFEEALAIDESDERPLSLAIRVEYETGNSERADKYLERMTARELTGPGTHAYTSSFQALSLARPYEINGNDSYLARAKAISETVIAAGVPTGSAERHHRAVLLTVAIYTDDIDLARENFAPLRKMGYGGDFGMGLERTLAQGATLLGMLEEAESIYEEALSKRRKNGHQPEYAWTCFNYSSMLIVRNGNGDLELAKKLIGEATDIVNKIGMVALESKLKALNAELSQRSGPQTLPAGLSKRELEVLKLVATGMTNNRIADELFISTNTVIRHVSNIMAKTKTSSRTEAGLFAERNGLL
ncbi:MAG: AAA family ATPase [Dehalococcoidia bacterium]